MRKTKFKKWLTKAQLAWARACSLKRDLHRTVGCRSFRVRSWLASSDLNDEGLGFARLQFAYSSLKRAGSYKF